MDKFSGSSVLKDLSQLILCAIEVKNKLRIFIIIETYLSFSEEYNTGLPDQVNLLVCSHSKGDSGTWVPSVLWLFPSSICDSKFVCGAWI